MATQFFCAGGVQDNGFVEFQFVGMDGDGAVVVKRPLA